jgi:transcriptional regulator
LPSSLAAAALSRYGRTLAFNRRPCRRIRSAAFCSNNQRDLIRRLLCKASQEIAMYSPPFFQPDRAASLAFAGARGFGTVCAYDGSKPVASALPFCLEYLQDGTPVAAFHVARRNALAALAGGKSNWLIAVNGPDAYVSPHWYASPDQVPTWLYQAVHLSGPVRAMCERELADHLDALSGRFESCLASKQPWTSREMPAGRRQAMMKAITGLVMTVEDIEGSFKLNQHKSDVDHTAIAIELSQRGDADAQTIGKRMVALRPQLDYKSPTPAGASAEGRNAP